MSTGPQTTFKFLAKTENEAAVDVLISALDCGDKSTRNGALRSILERRGSAGHRAVFKRLPKMDESAKKIIDERPDRMEQVVASVLKNPDTKICKSVCKVIVAYRLYDAMPALGKLLADDNDDNTALVAETMLKLTEAYYGELSGVEEQSNRRDKLSLRDRLTSTLEQATRKFHRHRRTEVVEAFLIVTQSKNSALRQIIHRSSEACHKPIMEALSNSQRGGVISLLLGFIKNEEIPLAVVKVISRRQDSKFLSSLLDTVGSRPVKQVRESISRIESLAWAQPGNTILRSLDPPRQGAAVVLLMGSSINRDEVLDVIGYLLREGNVGGRRAAAKALAEFEGSQAAQMVVASINDEDPQVRANLLVQLRPRSIPGAFSMLIRMIGGAEREVRASLRKALPEFTTERFLYHFDRVDKEMRQTTGLLVNQLNEDIISTLTAEFEHPSPVRRRKAVMAASAMGVVGDLEKDLIKSLSDDDHMVRVAVAQALADCKSMPTWDALRDALLDKSYAVKQAAEQSLQRISQSLAQQLEEDELQEQTS